MTVDEGSDPSLQARSPSGFPIEVLPGLVCVGVFTAWAVAGGGFATSSWAPGGLFLIALLGAVLLGARPRLSEIPIHVRIALGFLGAFVVWNFLSITWADVQGIAWDGAN